MKLNLDAKILGSMSKGSRQDIHVDVEQESGMKILVHMQRRHPMDSGPCGHMRS